MMTSEPKIAIGKLKLSDPCEKLKERGVTTVTWVFCTDNLQIEAQIKNGHL